jgi:hypothetical protein
VPSRRDAAQAAHTSLAAKVIALAWTERLPLDGLWIVQRDGTSDQLRDELRPSIGADVGLLILEIGQDAAWAGVSAAVGAWLLEKLSAWESSDTAPGGEDRVGRADFLRPTMAFDGRER